MTMLALLSTIVALPRPTKRMRASGPDPIVAATDVEYSVMVLRPVMSPSV